MKVSGETKREWAADQIDALSDAVFDLADQIERLQGDVGDKTYRRLEQAAPILQSEFSAASAQIRAFARELRDSNK